MTKQEEILSIEAELNIKLPLSYKSFLEQKGSDIAFGLPILGLPATYDLNSALGATYLLRTIRPELEDYLAIRILEDRMLCLDLKNLNLNDAPLVEININSKEPPTTVHNSFLNYINEAEQSKKQVEYGLRRIKNLISNEIKVTYIRTKNKNIPFKARNWRIHRCCVHDLVVGLVAFKYNETFNGVEVDTFLSTEHFAYEEGHGTKALMTLILSDAYRNGTSMEVRFTKFDATTRKRIVDNIPINLITVINSFGIKLLKKNEGIITHSESISIFSSLIGVQDEAKIKIKELELINEVTLQGICFLINSRVWTIEQVNWLILNATRVKAIIFGRDNPENRINYSESLSLGRSVCALTKLKEKIEISSSEELNEVEINIKGILYSLTSFKSCSIDWLQNGEYFEVEASETLIVHSRPRSKWINLKEQISEDINEVVKSAKGKKLILYSNNVFNYPDFFTTFLNPHFIEEVNKRFELSFFIIPFSAEELDEEVITKMKKARTYRV